MRRHLSATADRFQERQALGYDNVIRQAVSAKSPAWSPAAGYVGCLGKTRQMGHPELLKGYSLRFGRAPVRSH